MKNTLIILGVVLVMGGIIGLAIWKFRAIAQAEAETDAQVIGPYLMLIKAGKSEEAWERYTSPAYKQRFPRDEHTRGLRDLAADRGNLVRWEKTLGSELSQPGRGTFLQLKYRVVWDKGPYNAAYEVVTLEDGRRAIDASYEIPLGGGLSPAPR